MALLASITSRPATRLREPQSHAFSALSSGWLSQAFARIFWNGPDDDNPPSWIVNITCKLKILKPYFLQQMFGSGHFDAKYLFSIMLTSLKAQNISWKSSFLNDFSVLNFIGSACTEWVLDISARKSSFPPLSPPSWTIPSCEAWVPLLSPHHTPHTHGHQHEQLAADLLLQDQVLDSHLRSQISGYLLWELKWWLTHIVCLYLPGGV